MGLSEEDKAIVFRSRKMEKFTSQPFAVAEQFTGLKGSFVPLSNTIQGFRDIMDGEYDDTPELAFYMIGGTDEIADKAEDVSGTGAFGQDPGGQGGARSREGREKGCVQ